MKFKDAEEYIEDCRKEDGSLDESELINLVLWAYDRGYSESREHFREEVLM
jgi:hypothetical protein